MRPTPDWFTEALPKVPLDGELWCGRGLFHKTMSIVKKKVGCVLLPQCASRSAGLK